MTLSVPSFLAAATSPDIPPRSLAEVAADALTPPLELSAVFAGGEQAAIPMRVSVARAATPVRRAVRVFTSTSGDDVGSSPQQASAAECLDSACEREKYVSRCPWRRPRRI